MKIRKLVVWPSALLIALMALVILPQSAVEAEQWKVIDDDWCDDNDWRDSHCEIRETTIDADMMRVVRVDGHANGGITVEGWDRDEIRIRAKVRVWADSRDEAREIADDIEVVVDDRGIEARGPKMRDRWHNKRGWSVSLQLMVPTESDLDLTTTNGGIGVDGVSGDIRFEATNGGVTLADVGGDVRGHTTNGGLTVRLDGKRWRGEGMDVFTTNGGVTLKVPEDYSADLETGTVNGSIQLDFPVMVEGKIGKKLKTRLGDGGAPLKVRTTNGGVRVKRI